MYLSGEVSFLLKLSLRNEYKLCLRAHVLWAARRATAALVWRGLTFWFCYGTGKQPYWLKYFWTSLLNLQVDLGASVPKNLKPKLSVLNLSIQWEKEGGEKERRTGAVLGTVEEEDEGGSAFGAELLERCWEHGQLDESPVSLCSLAAWWVAPRAVSRGIGAWMGLRPSAEGNP